MQPAILATTQHGEKLAWDDIARLYPDQYVILVDFDFPNMGRVTAGVVVGHASDSKTAFSLRRELTNVAILWTGKPRGFWPPWSMPHVD